MAGILTVFLVILSAAGILAQKGTFFLTYPNVITRGSDFTVSVDILNGSRVHVTAILEQSVYNGKTRRYESSYLKNVTSTFSQGQKGALEFKIEPDFKCARCKLLVQGRGSQVFERSKPISVSSKVVSILIQMDKAIYKPGQRVRYRAFAVYPNLRIYNGPLSVKIKDPSGNKLVVLKGLRNESGVVEGFLNLSDQPPFGDWSIQVSAEDLMNSKTEYFTVAEYELPRFEVIVDIPPYALLSDTTLSGTVKAKYTYGKPVKGLVDLYVGPDGFTSCGEMPKSVNLALKVDGEASFSVPKSSILRVMGVHANTNVRVTAFVKEDATGVRLNGSKLIQYYSNEFSVSFTSNTPNVFKPGLPYTAFVQVQSPDGLPPPEDGRIPIEVYSYAQYQVTHKNQSKYGISEFTGNYPLPKITLRVPANGIIPINIDIPGNATNIVLQAFFKTFSARHDIRKTYSPSNNYMHLSLLDSNIQAGDTASFQLQATESLDMIFYEIISRGNVLKIGTIRGGGRSTVQFDLELTSSMAPVANLLTYYIRKDTEIVADSIAFNIDGVFENEVSIEFNEKEVLPHSNVKLNVQADPKSHVFLLVVDRSVLLLKSGNDIEVDKVENEISSQKPLDSELALSYSAANVGEVFTKSGLDYITDAVMQEPYRPRPYGRRGYYPEAGMDGLHFDAMPMPAIGNMGGSDRSLSSVTPLKPVERIRQKFPEAWLWTETLMPESGTSEIDTVIPDTITTWVASAFATNQMSGLGVAVQKANITVFKSFFVSLNYPSIVKKNEQAVIQATIFNYLSSTAPVTVTMNATNGYQHIDSEGNDLQGFQQKKIQIRPNSEAVVYFPILATEIGDFNIEVRAKAPMAFDGVRRQISIEPEGAPASFNVPVYINQESNSKEFRTHSLFSFPESTVPGSEKIMVSVSGDLIGPSLDNIDDLLRIPMGCGEQNMAKFAPSLYAAEYLETTNQLSDSRRQHLVDILAAGYQRQLSYLRSDASFSAFGNNDQSGSTWLTAHVSRTLSEARQFIYVDPQLLINAIDWLVERQRDDGAFVELGRVIDPNTQGKNSGPALTAFCLLSLLQNRDLISEEKCTKLKKNCDRTERWMNATREAIGNLESKLSTVNDPFPLAVVSYALNKAGSRKAQAATRKMRRKLKTEGGLTYLGGEHKTSPKEPVYHRIWDPTYNQPSPKNILSTSYAILTYTSRGLIRQAIPMVKWLVEQRNSQGGFSSTQDTTVGLQALAAFATRSVHPNTRLDMHFEMSNGESLEFNLNRRNLLNLQKKEFQNTKSDDTAQQNNIAVTASGNGFAIAEIDYSFHTKEVVPSKAFDVSTVLLDDELDNFNLMICTKWLEPGQSGMVVQEIEIPSGFEPDLTTIGNVADMKKYERKGNMAVVYFDEISKTSTCYSILMTRKAKVARSERTVVHTFSYYQPESESIVFYQPTKLRDASICDVCPGCCRL